MLIFYIICGVVVFGLSGFLFHSNRIAIYRRRIIRTLAETNSQTPFILSATQEKQIKQCFLEGKTSDECIKTL